MAKAFWGRLLAALEPTTQAGDPAFSVQEIATRPQAPMEKRAVRRLAAARCSGAREALRLRHHPICWHPELATHAPRRLDMAAAIAAAAQIALARVRAARPEQAQGSRQAPAGVGAWARVKWRQPLPQRGDQAGPPPPVRVMPNLVMDRRELALPMHWQVRRLPT